MLSVNSITSLAVSLTPDPCGEKPELPPDGAWEGMDIVAQLDFVRKNAAWKSCVEGRAATPGVAPKPPQKSYACDYMEFVLLKTDGEVAAWKGLCEPKLKAEAARKSCDQGMAAFRALSDEEQAQLLAKCSSSEIPRGYPLPGAEPEKPEEIDCAEGAIAIPRMTVRQYAAWKKKCW